MLRVPLALVALLVVGSFATDYDDDYPGSYISYDLAVDSQSVRICLSPSTNTWHSDLIQCVPSGFGPRRPPPASRSASPSLPPHPPLPSRPLLLLPQVNLSDTVTVSWSGWKSHPSDWQDWDWIAAFQHGACNGSDSAGENTCYTKNAWAWMTSEGVDDGAGSWAVSFDGPGTYEFRASYCGCAACVDFVADFATCSGYVVLYLVCCVCVCICVCVECECESVCVFCLGWALNSVLLSSHDRYMLVGLSPPVVVNPPFDLSKFSPGVQFVLGILWVELEASMSSMSQLLKPPIAQPSCTTCLCTTCKLNSLIPSRVCVVWFISNASPSAFFPRPPCWYTRQGERRLARDGGGSEGL